MSVESARLDLHMFSKALPYSLVEIGFLFCFAWTLEAGCQCWVEYACIMDMRIYRYFGIKEIICMLYTICLFSYREGYSAGFLF